MLTSSPLNKENIPQILSWLYLGKITFMVTRVQKYHFLKFLTSYYLIPNKTKTGVSHKQLLSFSFSLVLAAEPCLISHIQHRIYIRCRRVNQAFNEKSPFPKQLSSLWSSTLGRCVNLWMLDPHLLLLVQIQSNTHIKALTKQVKIRYEPSLFSSTAHTNLFFKKTLDKGSTFIHTDGPNFHTVLHSANNQSTFYIA